MTGAGGRLGGRPRCRPLIVGFGVTGRALARVLAAPLVIEDLPGDDAAAVAAELGVELIVAPATDRLATLVAGVSEVVPSPGVPPHHPVFRLAEAAGVPVVSEIEVAWRLLEGRKHRQGSPPVLVAVTGTNGKTTVATWVGVILEEAGRRAVLAGNIGHPLVTAVGEDADVVVAEVSSFQLNFTDRFRPSVSGWLNLSEDHLDWHPSGAHYAAAKARIWANQGPGDTAVINADDPVVAAAAASLPDGVRLVPCATRVGPSSCAGRPAAQRWADDGFFDDGRSLLGPGDRLIIGVDELPRRLPHDRANALAAAAVAWAAGADLEACRRGLRRVPALPHRVTLVAQGGGVAWYDDSKATTPASVRAAVAGFASVVLIAGGRNKGLDLSVLSELAPPVRAVVAVGESAGEVAAAFEGRVPVVTAASMEAAVRTAAAVARPGDAVLLSPGCASFDWYRSYAERGDHFADLVRQRIAPPEAAAQAESLRTEEGKGARP